MLRKESKHRSCFTQVLIPVTLMCAFILLPVTNADQASQSAERAWTHRAQVLVEKAATSLADAKTFTEYVRAHRADLRQLMRESGTDISQQHRQLHMSMVLLGVLLKTAAGCQSGGHVVCPPSLLYQLRTVLKNTVLKLDAYEGQQAATGTVEAAQ